MAHEAGAALKNKCAALAEELGLCRPAEIDSVAPLSGGVSSEIAVLSAAGRRFCVKFALEKLRVKQDWRAPLERNRAEYAWLSYASRIAPESVPELYGHSASLNGFAMEYLDPGESVQWKSEILSGSFRTEDAVAAARLVGRLHAASCHAGTNSSEFGNSKTFHEIRVDPYILAAASRHPQIAPILEATASNLMRKRHALIHGDVSPKNILLRGGRPVLLDAECATMGDPAFDIAFLLNHLAIKALHLPELRPALLAGSLESWREYATLVDWESARDLEHRVCRLLPALMLARMDGKSPVEYLSATEQDRARGIAIRRILNPPGSISEFLSGLETA